MGAVAVIRSEYITRRVLELVPGASEPEFRFDGSGLAGWFLATIDGKRRTVAWWRLVSVWAGPLDDDEIAAHIAKELAT
jgi:hypothetical protein